MANPAETGCREAIGVAPRANSNEDEAKTRMTRSRGEFKKAAETSCGEARAAADRANSREAEVEPCQRLRLGRTQAKEVRCLDRVTTKAARPFPIS